MEEVRQAEVRATVEDLMYVSVLEKFVLLGIDMLPRLDGEPLPAKLTGRDRGCRDPIQELRSRCEGQARRLGLPSGTTE
jgi:hypothetical protein